MVGQASAAALCVSLTAIGGNVFTISTNGTNNIGTVTMSGSTHPNAALVGTGTGTGGSDSITWGAQAGVATFTFNMVGNWEIDSAEFGTAGGLGNIGENTGRQRPVGYAASFSGTVADANGAADLTLNSTVSNTGATLLPSFPATTSYTAGQYVVNRFFIPVTANDEYLIQSGTGLGNAPITFTYGLSNGGGDTDAARFSFKVVPEPSRALLLALGALGLLLRRQR